MKPNTIVEVFFAMLEHNLDSAQCCRVKGGWMHISARELHQRTIHMARALRSWGIRKGDRTAILSENRPEWAIADFATLLIGAVDVPVYTTLTTEQTAYILKDAGVRVAFVSTMEQFRKVRSILSETSVEKIVVMDDIVEEGATSMRNIMTSPGLDFARDAEIEALAANIQTDDLATIIYTSGTTGVSKGVMLTHGNLAANVYGANFDFSWSKKQGYVSFLPLSHVTARHIDYSMFFFGMGITYCPHFKDLMDVVREVRPYNFISVPRVYEKIRQEVERRVQRGIHKLVYQWALHVGRDHRAEVLAGRKPMSLRWKLANSLVFHKILGAFGGRTEIFVSGGAPMGIELAEWFADVGIRIAEGYGLTETSPVIAVNTIKDYKLGTVGKPLINVECKIADDGELLVRGPSVTKGYWNLPEETKNAFVDGWFKTGDIGHIDEDGFLSITDRKKDLIKTSGGKFIAPQPIENKLKSNVLVSQAALIGDKRKFVSVIIAPNFPLLEEWAHAHGIKFQTREELIGDETVCAMYQGIVDTANAKLARFERLKKVILVPDEFSVASGELTPSMKLKRRVVEKKYAHLIEELYASVENSEMEPSEVK